MAVLKRAWLLSLILHAVAILATTAIVASEKQHHKPLKPIALALVGPNAGGDPSLPHAREGISSARIQSEAEPALELEVSETPPLDASSETLKRTAGARSTPAVPSDKPPFEGLGRRSGSRRIAVATPDATEAAGGAEAEAGPEPGGPAPIVAGSGEVKRTGGKMPEYPEAARRAGREGKVRLEIDINECGCVAAVRIRESSGHGDLDEAAIEAVRTWTFAPLVREGKAVAARVRLPVEFRMKN